MSADSIFRLQENRTTVRTEVLAGLTTFLTMAYIIFVQPAVLSGSMFGKPTGMDFGAVTAATCIAAAVSTAIMGLYARYPICQAPGMGENFFFVFSAIPAAAAAGCAEPWRAALGTVFISGVIFLLISLTRLREMLFDAISPSMKSGIAAGIGLFIAFIGMQNAGVILKDPGTAVRLNAKLASPDMVVFFTGLLVACVLHVRRTRGALLWGIVAGTAMAVSLRLALPHAEAGTSRLVAESMLMQRFTIAHRLVSAPPSLAPTLLGMDLRAALSATMWPFILIFLFMVLFDTIGTLIGVGEQAGFIKDNKLPRVRQAMLSDAAGSVIGAALGTSTVTSFVESTAGVQAGGRTGLTALTAAALFLVALFFSPVIAMVGSYPPITAPALVFVGAMMVQSVLKVQFDDASESVPAFLVMAGIPFTYSIADGLALGFIAYPLVKLLGGRGREVSWVMYVLAAVLVGYFVFLRSRLG